MDSAFFLVGPTAVGKTEVAHCLADMQGRSILSADSMLVYREMDIGTAKPAKKDLAHYNYRGVDIVDPDEEFNLCRYLEHSRDALEEMGEKPPIAVGGTGLYVKSLIRGLDDAGKPNPALRTRAESILKEDGIDALREFVRERAPGNYERLKDKHNPRRLVRALEGPRRIARSWERSRPQKIVGVHLERDRLLRRIEKRVDRMYREGLLEEIEHLLKEYNLSRTARQAIGYKEGIEVVKGRTKWEAARERICIRTRRLAKSQMNWFRNQEDVGWVEIGENDDPNALAERVAKLWTENGRTELGL